MSVLGIVALVFGVLGVVFTIRQSIWCWPFSLISVIASITEFYNEKLFGDMSLQVIYFFLGIYGWVYWYKQSAVTFTVKKIERKNIPLLLLVTVLQSVVYYYLLIYFKGDRPLLDGILTAASLTTTYMMTKKWVENWLAWTLIDGSYILLYGLKEMWLFCILYFLFTIIAFYGWLKWRKTV